MAKWTDESNVLLLPIQLYAFTNLLHVPDSCT